MKKVLLFLLILLLIPSVFSLNYYVSYLADNNYLYLAGNTFYFNESKLNTTISALSNDTDTHVAGDGDYLTNDSTTMYFNETKLNATISSLDTDTTYINGTGLALTGTTFSIVLSYFQSLFWELTDITGYIFNNGGSIDVNETKLNATIQALSDMNTDTHVAGDGIYLTNDSTTMYFNETKLNATITAIDSDTTYTALGTYVELSGTQFYMNETKLNATINANLNDTLQQTM